MVLGSPAANPIRTFDFHCPTKDLEIEHGELEIREFSLGKTNYSRYSSSCAAWEWLLTLVFFAPGSISILFQ
jgi:hypothetical protein